MGLTARFAGLYNVIFLLPVFPLLHWTGVETFELPPNGSAWLICGINMLITLSSDYLYILAVLKTSPMCECTLLPALNLSGDGRAVLDYSLRIGRNALCPLGDGQCDYIDQSNRRGLGLCELWTAKCGWMDQESRRSGGSKCYIWPRGRYRTIRRIDNARREFLLLFVRL